MNLRARLNDIERKYKTFFTEQYEAEKDLTLELLKELENMINEKVYMDLYKVMDKIYKLLLD